MATSLDEIIEFLGIAASKGFLNENTVNARRTACNKFFDILDPDQKNVEYVRDHLDVIKARFSNLNKDVAGGTIDEYARRVQLVLNDFTEWSADRAGWERRVSAKQTARPAGDSEKKARAQKTEKQQPHGNGAAAHASASGANGSNPNSRVATFPIRPDFDLSITLPRDGLTVPELQKLVYFLLPYVPTWQPTQSPRSVFPMIQNDEEDDARR